MKKKTAWSALLLERQRDGFHLLVARSANGVRWRYAVSSLEYVQRPLGRLSRSFARASGYMTTRERAMAAAEAACDGLVRAGKEKS